MLSYLVLVTHLQFFLPDSPILNSDVLLNSVESVPDPPHHRIPALLSDSLLTASRHSSSPVAVKPMLPPPSQPASDPPSSLDPLEFGMEVTVDFKRKLVDASPKHTKKGKKKPSNK